MMGLYVRTREISVLQIIIRHNNLYVFRNKLDINLLLLFLHIRLFLLLLFPHRQN